jgi:Fic family protein
LTNLALQIISTDLLEQYRNNFDKSIADNFEQLEDSTISIESFSFYTSVSAVFSSKIEGEDIDIDSFIKHKRFGVNYLPDYTQKIDDLYDAYSFAQQNNLTQSSFEWSHAMLTKNILQQKHQGKIRTGNMYVLTDDGRIEYVAASPNSLASEMGKLYADIETLLQANLSFEEIFFFASMLHLVFVKIHPFEDGNGRAGRLLEKWFLAAKLGAKAWYVQSEKHYYNNHQLYYNILRQLGLEYEELQYGIALPFLEMLPKSVLL